MTPAHPRARASRAALLGAGVATPLAIAEVAARATSAGALVSVASVAVGASVAVAATLPASHPRWGRPWLAALLVAPVAAGLPRLDTMVARALELAPRASSVAVPIVAAALGAGGGAVTWVATRERVTARRLRPFLAGSSALAVFLAALAPLEERAHLAARALAAAASLGALGLALSRGRGAAVSRVILATLGAAGTIGLPFTHPWEKAICALVTLAAALLAAAERASAWVARGSPDRRITAAWAAASLASLALAESTISAAGGRFDTGSRGGPTFAIVRLGRAVTDVDGDGFGQLFGQRDCAPLDPAVHPGRHEIPGNEVDENCLGGPAPADGARWIREAEAVHTPPPHHAGDVLLVTVDALRRDDAMDPSLPNLGGWAERGLVFDRAFATSTFTAQSLPGLLASHLPSWRTYSFPRAFCAVPDRGVPGLFAALAALGFDGAFAGGFDVPDNPVFAASTNAAGLRVLAHTRYEASPSETLAAARAAFGQLDPSRRRLLWVHFMWLHHRSSDRGTYRAAVREVDAAIAGLLELVGPEALAVITADHGEAFGEHGSRHHASTLFSEVASVPLFVRWPDGPRGRVRSVTSLRAIGPTVRASVAGDRAPPGAGPYLCTRLDACSDMPAPMALELPNRHLHGLVVGDHHVIRDVASGDLFAFDLALDPAELEPLRPPPAEVQASLEAWEERAFGLGDPGAWPYDAR